MSGDRVLVEAVINGVTPKSWNPNVPRSVSEVTADIGACFDGGASIVHSHAGDGASGPQGLDFYVEAWRPVLEKRPGAVLYPTVGSSGTLEERMGHVRALCDRGYLRVAAIDPGSTNLGVLGPEGAPLPTESVYANSFALIEEFLSLCREQRLAATFAIFEPTFLHAVLAYEAAQRLPPGSWIKFYLGGAGGYPGAGPRGRQLPFGLPPTVKALDAYLEMLDGSRLPWGVSACGADVVGCGLARAALERGGHVHVGLEMYDGPRRPTNAELVEEVVTLCRDVGREPLRWDEVPDYLGFPDR